MQKKKNVKCTRNLCEQHQEEEKEEEENEAKKIGTFILHEPNERTTDV